MNPIDFHEFFDKLVLQAFGFFLLLAQSSKSTNKFVEIQEIRRFEIGCWIR